MDDDIGFLTELTDAKDPNPTNEASEFGILDLKTIFITDPPNFTEEFTLKAMEKLKVSSNDLVYNDLHDYSGEENIRLQVLIDIEEKRMNILKKIILTRQKIIKRANKLPSLKKKGSPMKRNDDLLPSNRRKRAKSSARSSKSLYEPYNEHIQSQARSLSVETDEEAIKIQKEEFIRKRAALRLKNQEKNVKSISKQIEKSRRQSQIDLQKQRQAVNRIQEKKKKEYEQEMKWRRENIYKAAQLPTKHKASHSSIAMLRKKLILNHSSEKNEIKSVSSMTHKQASKIPHPLNNPRRNSILSV